MDLLTYVKNLVAMPDTVSANLRRALSIPSSNNTPVQLAGAGNRTICSRARAAFVAATGSDTISTPQVDVISIGAVTRDSLRYVVTDRKAHAGEFRVDVVMDSSFKVLANIGG